MKLILLDDSVNKKRPLGEVPCRNGNMEVRNNHIGMQCHIMKTIGLLIVQDVEKATNDIIRLTRDTTGLK